MKAFTRRNVIVGAVVLAAAAGGGVAIGATQLDSPTARSQAIVNDAAKQLGIQPAALSAALKKAEEDQIDAEVAAGQLTKAQGDALKAAIEAGNVPLVGTGPLLGHGWRGGMFGVGLDAAASYLGLSEAQLRADLQSGKTLAQIATGQGKTADGLVSALVDAAKKQLDAAVAAGRLTASQEQAIEANLEQGISAVVNGQVPLPMPMPGLGLGLGGLHGLFGDLVSAATSYLGLSEAQLRADLQSGKTLAQIATGQGKTADGLVSALVDAAKKQLDAAVAAGRLTASQEQAIEANLEQGISAVVNGQVPTPGLFGGPFGGHRFGGFGRFGGFRVGQPALPGLPA